MKKIFFIVIVIFSSLNCISCNDDNDSGTETEPVPESSIQLATRNITRAIALVDTVVPKYFSGANMTMSRYYNPYLRTASSEVGSVWMYTGAIEAVNSIMESLKEMKALTPSLYESNYNKYEILLGKLYEGLEYYSGTYELTSYTQTKNWTVYAVNRCSEAGKADVSGESNVYDDQEWLIREILRSYKITGNKEYLEKAEYLTEYVLDGWDCTLNTNGEENGGITWGPAYISKHSCSNGPLISSLVWLYEIYRGKGDQITYKKVDLNDRRYDVTQAKSQYYLDFAKKVYTWQKKYLMMDSGVYYDLIGADADELQYEKVNGETYRKGLPLSTPGGAAYTYNSGTMLSGGAELYRVTHILDYRKDITALTTASFNEFAKKDASKVGYYSYPITDFSTWFNDVLLRGYLDAYGQKIDSKDALESYQANLDYGYANYLYKGMLPVNLLVGWSWTKANNNIEALFSFAFISEYAMLAHYERQKLDE